jgi:murein DD-endopeptidase MepM/ murein hydrolase activator NlpD
MAFVILSAGTLTGSSLHTMRLRTLVVAAATLLGLVLGAGVALGVSIARPAGAIAYAVAPGTALALDPQQPGSRVLIDRISTLYARLIRLESEAVSLARQVGVAEGGADAPGGDAPPDQAAAGTTAEPSGGPLLAPLDSEGDFAPVLARFSRNLDFIDATFARVSQAAAVRNLASMAFPSRSPVEGGSLSSGFGNRRDPFTRRLARHSGLDIRAPRGAPILASAGGRVTFAGYRGAYGYTVEIDHGNGLRTRYGHASKLLVRKGDVVLPRQRIGAVGSTGRSTGPHLHFEVLRNGTQVEPRNFLAPKGHRGEMRS